MEITKSFSYRNLLSSSVFVDREQKLKSLEEDLTSRLHQATKILRDKLPFNDTGLLSSLRSRRTR